MQIQPFREEKFDQPINLYIIDLSYAIEFELHKTAS